MTMIGTGVFEKQIHELGTLRALSLNNGMEFVRADNRIHPVFCGNRVNLYINDFMSVASRTTPGLKFGISVGWSFQADTPTAQNLKYRTLDKDTVYPITTLDFLELPWQETKIEFSPITIGADLQVGKLDYDVYQLPPINTYFAGPGVSPPAPVMNIRRVIPLVARGDFIRVFFWCDPPTFVGTPADLIEIYFLAGSDVAGSQRI